MFDNIGKKLKNSAVTIAWVGIIVSILTGIGLIGVGADMRHGGDAFIALGIGAIVIGSLISWVSSFFMYGFGELIEKTTEIAQNTSKKGSGGSLTSKMENEKKLATLIQWKENGLISDEEFEAKKQALLKEE